MIWENWAYGQVVGSLPLCIWNNFGCNLAKVHSDQGQLMILLTFNLFLTKIKMSTTKKLIYRNRSLHTLRDGLNIFETINIHLNP